MPEISKITLDQIIWNEWSKNKTANIKEIGLDFVMDAMPFKARFKHSVQDEKPFTYEAEGKSISFKPIGMWWTTPQGKTAARAVSPSVGSLTEGKVKYPNAFGNGIDIVCSTGRTRWRKEIIIKSLQSLGTIPVDAEYLEIGFEIETDFDIEDWDKKSELKFNRAIKLSELSQLESIKTWDSHIIPEPKEDEESEDPFERCDGFLRVVDGKYFLVKRIPADYLRDAVYPVTTDVEIAFGSEYEFNTVDTRYLSVAALDATHFVVSFTDYGSAGYGIARIGVVSSGDAIAYGSEYTFNSASTSNTSVARLDNTHFVVGFADGFSYGPGIAMIGTVTGDVIAYGSEYEFNAANSRYLSVAALDSTHFVIGFQDYGGPDYGIAMIGVVSSGDQIAFGSEYEFNSAISLAISVAALDSTHFVVSFRDNGGTYGHARIGVVTGDAIAYGSEYTFNSASTYDTSVARLDATHFVVGFRDGGDVNHGKASIGVVTGDAIAYGSKYEFNAGTTFAVFVAALDDTHFVVGFRDVSGSSYGIAMIGTVSSEDVIAYGSEYPFNSTGTNLLSVAVLDTTHFVVVFRDDGGLDYGIAMIGTYTPPAVGDIDTPAKRRMAAGIIPFHSVIIPDGTIGLKDRMQIACLYSENAVAILVGIPIHFMYYQRLRRN